ncbi:MAG: hypothetical protein UU10_C0002G0023 [Parcubacteria group bacterium GW2011_GWF1_40_6]|uniref:Uncharacterized protein n=2 Tax=Candidatus Nomuraibacteriota TaxID=1752729 RepID=A0A0G0QTS5_9BACT|nr:MAG: hypothetical protein UT78_C0001G0050 [Candidatus Nomurabacteria bacterium GW2011_GWF2_40_12]KKR69937.1 MAG: hypothetical protein UU10_C0002G0023 [Parcubacteria group bacterium GW2011_GWF1_40_6]OGJ09510.1 MAG: hypothetical protein A2356_03080 [Candidatus Nomurabacteria bacterium RIFOXYB1_FULL_39_16]OGJ15440.1 MAG: hypothetical protein A2585_00380 [Candidatus Nomurabacteria bacterium RIFOXYD1_FULL_39_12]
MKSIQRLFEKIAREHPNWGSVIVFNHIVNGKNFSHDRIARWFNLLVDKEEYDRSEKKQILEYIYLLNSPLNRTKNDGIKPSRREKIRKTDKDDINAKRGTKITEII